MKVAEDDWIIISIEKNMKQGKLISIISSIVAVVILVACIVLINKHKILTPKQKTVHCCVRFLLKYKEKCRLNTKRNIYVDKTSFVLYNSYCTKKGPLAQLVRATGS